MGQSIQEWIISNFLTAVFYNFYLVHSWILCSIYNMKAYFKIRSQFTQYFFLCKALFCLCITIHRVCSILKTTYFTRLFFKELVDEVNVTFTRRLARSTYNLLLRYLDKNANQWSFSSFRYLIFSKKCSIHQ